MKTIGNEVLFVKPSMDNPRNTEGAFAVLKDGTLMFAYSRFVGGCSDHSEAELYAVFSRDDGETWGEGRTILKKRSEDINIMSVSFLRMQDESLGMFFLRKTGDNCLVNLVRSYDEGETWSEPVCCTPDSDYYVCVNDSVIRLKSGRVIIPVSRHSEYDASIPLASERGAVYFFISDDDCRTFYEAKECLKLPFSDSFTGLQEPGVMELKDGRLWAWARTGHGYQFEAYSNDEGETWSKVNPNPFFTSPNSPMGAKWIQNDRILAVFNPIPYYNGRFSLKSVESPHSSSSKLVDYDMNHPYSVYGGRTPLTCAISKTDPHHFEPLLMNLENNPDLGFCYPAILPYRNFVLISYFISGDTYGYPDAENKLFGLKIKKVTFQE